MTPEQLSLATGAKVTTALVWPAGRLVTMFAGQVMVGAVVSCTMTLAAQEFDAPRLSTTVSVTAFVPFAYGPGGVRKRFVIEPSESVEPLSTSVADTSAWQLPFAFVVTLRHAATGGVLEWATVTVKEQVFVLPEVSVAVQVTVVVPSGTTDPDRNYP